MFGIFRKQDATDPDFLEWTVDFSKWAIDSFGGLEQIRNTPLIKPSPDFYPASKSSGHQRAEELFLQTKAHADMADWACSLTAQESQAPAHLGDGLIQQFHTNTPAGTYSESVKGDKIHSHISYDPALLTQPTNLIATFSHELAHLLMHGTPVEFPLSLIHI